MTRDNRSAGNVSMFQPNAQQLQTASEYSSPVVSWEQKTGEYSNESSPLGGYAAIATLANGLRLTIGRYGAVLAEDRPDPSARERRALDRATTELAEAIWEAHLTGSTEAACDRAEAIRDTLLGHMYGTDAKRVRVAAALRAMARELRS